ncbi:hypothetical protein ARMGADRAFT_1086984 [Armillaria gallica]|uniref:Uncharacterized protein n=1 Tax=Armillaria gallica TaxID=47427 RepID=A0A2H3D568_ARMGA|nr:hypothetical protein ARMGADRAFT_1086984 [Armillaria gallica]
MHTLSAKHSGKENPFTILLHRLIGLSILKPCKAQAFSLWAKENVAEVQKALDKELAKKTVVPGDCAAKLNAFKSKLFKKEFTEVQEEWAAQAEEDHEEALKEYHEKMEAPVSKKPEDMQRYMLILCCELESKLQRLVQVS